MAEFIRHTACLDCGSSDARALYSDGSEYCWSCGSSILSEEYKQALKEGKKLEKPAKDKPFLSEEETTKILEETTISGKGYRGIKDETYRKYKVRHSYNEETGKVKLQYYPITTNYEFSGFKVRKAEPKDFYALGNNSINSDLFGQVLFKSGGKHVLIQEGECFLPSTKILTRNGWVTLEDYNVELHGEVMQGNGEFALPLAKIYKDYSGELINYKSDSYEITTTPKHQMMRTRNGKNILCDADDLTKQYLPVPRVVDFKSEEDSLAARIQVMLSADFSFRPEGEIQGAFQKQRKIERARKLLQNSGIKYTEKEYIQKTRKQTSFYIWRHEKINASKLFSYQRDLPLARTIIDEIVHWDGNTVPNRNQIEFSTKILENAEFIQTCAHLCGYVSTIIPRSNKHGSWYKVSILFGKQTSSTQKGYTKSEYSGKVACLTMPAGTLLVKQGQSISVSGNCKSMAAYQMLREYYKSKGSEYEVACVCPTTGVKGVKQVQKAYQFLDSFENIILCLDNDKAGHENLEKYLAVLPRGKVKIMQLKLKDADEYLDQGREAEFVNAFWRAKKHVPVGIVASNTLSSAMREEIAAPKIPLPPFMHRLQKMMNGGIPLGRIVNLASASGTGKSTIIDEIIYYLIFNSPYKCAIVTLESSAAQYGIKLVSRHVSQKLELLPSEEALALLETEEHKQKEYELFNTSDDEPRFYLVEDRAASLDSVKQTIQDSVISLNCKVIVLDPLQDLIGKLSNEQQDEFCGWLKEMIKAHNVTFLCVNHMRKASSTKEAGSKGAEGAEEDIHGSSSIYKSGAANLVFSRNKEADDEIERNTTKMKATKIRWTGLTGPAGEYYYDNKTHTLYDKQDWLAKNLPSTLD